MLSNKQEVDDEISRIIRSHDQAKAAELFRALKNVNAGDNFVNVVTRLLRIAESTD